MTISFIGAGKVGTALGIFLKSKGMDVVGYYSRSMESAKKAAFITQTEVLESLTKVGKISDCIIITTSDDAIAQVDEQLSSLPVPWREKMVLHTSGLHSTDTLKLLSEKGATVCSVHPMLSFGDPIVSARQLEGAVFTIEGKGKKLSFIMDLLNQCGVQWVRINQKDKVKYHAAACMVSNYLVTLMDMGKKLLEDLGFSEEQALRLIKPLVAHTIENIFSMDTEKALTGPILRGDTGTIERHMDELKQYDSFIYEIYRLMGLKTAELAQRAERIDDQTATKLKEMLKNNG